LDRVKFADRSYGFLINENNEIPAEIVNELRIAIVNHLNAWESVAYLYNNDRIDANIIKSHLDPTDIMDGFSNFIALYGKNSWEPVNQMMRQMSPKAIS
jgi:hypothetical protein